MLQRTMRDRRVEGTCHLCGRQAELTFEHVPPRAAFNTGRVRSYDYHEWHKMREGEPHRVKLRQGGAGGYTLCAACNNNTGGWYGSAFVEWCYQGVTILRQLAGDPGLTYPFHIFPLRVLKQVVTMFFSVNGPRFGAANSALRDFVLSPESKGLPDCYGVLVHFSKDTRSRQSGVSAMLRLGSGTFVLSEIVFPPFGYLLTIGSQSPDRRLVDVSFFRRFGLNEHVDLHLPLHVLPVTTIFPADYRTEAEVEREARSPGAGSP
jgi:hypothetical protein